MLIFIIIIIVIIFFKCLLFFLWSYKKQKHKFWDKQPVSRIYINKEGIISTNSKFNIILKNNMFFKNIDITLSKNLIMIHNFINNNYNESYLYSIDFLKETLLYLNNNESYNIGLFNQNNEIIGFIHCKPINLSIKSKIQKFYYTDFLCVHKLYRKNNLAVILISKLITLHGRYQPFIFKKDNIKLPFNYINKSSYYYYQITNNKFINIKNNIIEANKHNLLDVYNFINKISNKKKIYQFLTFDEFKNLYTNTSKKIIIEYDINNKIIGIITYVCFNMHNNKRHFFEKYLPIKKKGKSQNSYIKTIDIENIYIYNNKNYELFYYLINYSIKNNIKIISCVDQSLSDYFIRQNNMKKSMDIYFHAYNYHLNNIVDKDNILFNFL